jgi:hypothetical protein
VRVYAKHYVRQRQNNLTTFFNFNEREIIRPSLFNFVILVSNNLKFNIFTILTLYCLLFKVMLVIPQFEFKLPPPKQTQEELFGSFVVHGW